MVKKKARHSTFERRALASKAQPQSHRNGTTPAAVLLEVVERTAGIIERNAVRNAEVRVVERVEHLESIAQLDPLGDAEVLEDAQIDVLIAVAQENVAPDIAE